ncbi:MAG: bifunctional methylenetetrahydrofolate dehydrogenase/methenyltetrahydrofolate cyclohydrolase FolD [Rhodobacteraceae bacterium]|nr:bifunctional methylenetetrahydrofolate dehydrogenase/methenyltetrahydrofolate cyclohydrolase FolD [Paracoccaceae bacterium]
MIATLIDGKGFAARLRADLAAHVAQLKEQTGEAPGLAVVLVGEDAASQVYVRSKERQTVEAGMESFSHRLPADVSEDVLLGLVRELNADTRVHGILVQFPLPGGLSQQKVIEAIDVDKDVDGFHVENVGRVAAGLPGLVPCTPLGCLMLLRDHLGDLTGQEAVVVGRSHTVGKPVAQLLINQSCTVTVAHSRTRDLPDVVRRGDIVVAAVGRPEMVKAEWLKPGCTVIDVGINRIDAGEGKTRLVGDVDAAAWDVAGAMTPVPGGVGPMTIACLLANTVTAFCRQKGLTPPAGLGL